MNKKQYVDELRQRLYGLEPNDIEDAISYCEEYFDEAGEGKEQQVMEDLGTPIKLAAQIRAESAIRRISNNTKTASQGKSKSSSLKTLSIILIGICALPIALPLLLVLGVLLFVLCITLAIVMFACIISFLAVMFGGIPMIIFGFLNLEHQGDALVSIGGGCFSIGIGLLLIVLSYMLMKSTIPLFNKGVSAIYRKAKGERRYEKI